jgi:hypothetical protein
MHRKICILGTYHAYQYEAPRLKFLQELKNLIEIHSVDLVAEEATGIPTDASYAKQLIVSEFDSKILWKNVDLTAVEREKVPDINPMGLGTLVDFDLHTLREWVWVIRTSKAMKDSALLICGLAHTFSVADKFQLAGLAVETNVYFDRLDEDNIKKYPLESAKDNPPPPTIP